MSDDFVKLRKALAGKFIVFDGPDGAGKTTTMQAVADQLNGFGTADIVCVREPGGTQYGEHIRNILLHTRTNCEGLDETAEMLLFVAARMQLMNHVVIPQLKAGKTVFADRFVSSTLAYQGEGLGIDYQKIIDIHKIAIPDEYWPACTLVLDVCDSVAFDRRCKKNQGSDRIESRSDDFRQKVRFGYLKQAAIYPEHIKLVDANSEPEDVCDACILALQKHLLGVGK